MLKTMGCDSAKGCNYHLIRDNHLAELGVLKIQQQLVKQSNINVATNALLVICKIANILG